MNRSRLDDLDLRGPRVRDLLSARDLAAADADLDANEAARGWHLSAFMGRLVEISGARDSAALTLTFHLIREAQRCGEPVVWIARKESIFYPPDAADLSVDVESLIVVWAARPHLATRAADQLIRSGGFGLVIVDLGSGSEGSGNGRPDTKLSLASLSRLAGLVKKHRVALLFLTEKSPARTSLGSLVSIHVQAERTRREDDLFSCRARALKDKRIGPGWVHEEVGHGPDGLH